MEGCNCFWSGLVVRAGIDDAKGKGTRGLSVKGSVSVLVVAVVVEVEGRGFPSLSRVGMGKNYPCGISIHYAKSPVRRLASRIDR